jgi:hypothetical protein
MAVPFVSRPRGPYCDPAPMHSHVSANDARSTAAASALSAHLRRGVYFATGAHASGPSFLRRVAARTTYPSRADAPYGGSAAKPRATTGPRTVKRCFATNCTKTGWGGMKRPQKCSTVRQALAVPCAAPRRPNCKARTGGETVENPGGVCGPSYAGQPATQRADAVLQRRDRHSATHASSLHGIALKALCRDTACMIQNVPPPSPPRGP